MGRFHRNYSLNKTIGSVYLRSETDIRPYYKTTDSANVNGWKPLVFRDDLATPTVKGLVNQMVNITNLAPDADLPTTVLKINAILTEMKSKGLMIPDTL